MSAEKKQRRKRQRAAIRHAMFTRGPVRLSGGRLSKVRPGKDFAVNQRVIDLPRLPDELCGLTITHVSDLHVGELLTPAHLPHIVEAVNALQSDLIAVTGDFIDFSNTHLPDVIDAMTQLEARLGVYMVLGNHDFLDSGEAVKKAFRKARLNLLLNEHATIQHYDKQIGLGGINWSDQPKQIARDVRDTVKSIRKTDLSILLAHHPHAFDSARRRGVDLTLSGHTHGGQLLFSNQRGKKGAMGPATVGFRYVRGLYQHGDSRLFVSSGVGSWFPLRIRCPAEITQLELQTTY